MSKFFKWVAVLVVSVFGIGVATAPTAQAADAPTVNFKVAVNGDTVTGTAITSGIAVCNLAITDTSYREMFIFPVHSPVGADGTLTFTKSGLEAGNYFFGGSCFSVDWEPVGGVVPFTIAPTTDPVDPVDPSPGVDVKAQVKALRAEAKAEIAALRAEAKALPPKAKSAKKALQSEIKQVRKDLQAQLKALRAKG